PLESVVREGRRDEGGVEEVAAVRDREREVRGHERRSVEQRHALLLDELERSEPLADENLVRRLGRPRGADERSLTRQREREMGERGEVPGGSHGPLLGDPRDQTPI